MLSRIFNDDWLKGFLLSGFFTLVPFVTNAADNHAHSAMRDTCVLIDNDFDIDDMMAIPTVIARKYVAAIIQSEGYTFPEQGAAAIDVLVNQLPDQPNQRKIPIIVGGKQNPAPDINQWYWVPFFRSMMNQAVGLLPVLPKPWPTDNNYVDKVVKSVADCQKVSVLIIGTYTSFIQYASAIKPKIENVITMGQHTGDNSRSPGRESFNCYYDWSACQRAMTLLESFKTYFVDIPRENDVGGICVNTLTPSPNCYSTSYEMVMGGHNSEGLKDKGLPGQLKRALTNPINCNSKYTKNSDPNKTMPNPKFLDSGLSDCTALSVWVPANVAAGPGGEMFLWDQSTALFLLHPELFSLYYPTDSHDHGGKHYEPTLINGSHADTAALIRRIWTKETNRGTNFQTN